MAQIFLNNCFASLAQAVTSSATQIVLEDMNGFPASLPAGDFFLLTLFSGESSRDANIEVVKVIGLSGTTVTVERGQEGFAAVTHEAGEWAESRLTAGSLGTAVTRDVAEVGNATAGQVVKGDDTRLTDPRTPKAHTHTKGEISDFEDADYATAAQGSRADTAHGWGNHASAGYVKTDTNTTYSAGAGIELTGTEFSLADERFTTAQKDKLSGVAAGATKYTNTNAVAAIKADPRWKADQWDEAYDNMGAGGGITVSTTQPVATENAEWFNPDTNESYASVPVGSGFVWVGQGAAPGNDGESIEMRVTASHIQYKYPGQSTWTSLIPLADLEGPSGADGREIELRTNATHIQHKYDTQGAWSNLYPLADLKGEKGDTGRGITVSATAPSNPQNNDLWVDIS